jgi:hypothetical protein
MSRIFPTVGLVAVLFLPALARAQWQNVTYSLQGGWNAIYLHGDASHATPDQLFAAYPGIVSVWRWNPNPNPSPLHGSSLIPSTGTPEWSVWLRGQPAQSSLASLVGRSAYLVRVEAPAGDTLSVTLPQRVVPPQSTWLRNGANLLGFPSRLAVAYPLFSDYFATFPAAIAAETRIYKYVGGDIGPANPIQVFSPASERLDRNRAYWFEAAVVGNFYAPLEIVPSHPAGLDYGRTGALVTVRVRNRTAAPVTLTVAPEDSAGAPAGQEAIVARVPLTRRTFDAGSGTYLETPLAASFNEVIAPQSAIELTFGLQRSEMSGTPDALYASLLRFTDSGGLLDVFLPATARVASFSGLWVGEATISGVQSKAPGASGTSTPRSYPLRVLLHVDDSGTARLLSQVFLGRLATAPHPVGLCTRESGLKSDEKAGATRLSTAHLPLDRAIATGTGSVGPGQTLVRTVTLPFNDRTNPFVHVYHPDHDNRDARGVPLGAGVESYDVTRECRFTFTASPPDGSSSVGWGASVIGGTYVEVVTGLHKDPLTVSGTFELRRVSEIGAIVLN